MHLAPTHAASDAQHRDRAAFIVNLSSRDDVYRRAHHDCSFICVPTPACCFAENWRASGRSADGSGGLFQCSNAVPRHGTRKRLKRQGKSACSTCSMVSPSRDACAGVCAGACVKASVYIHGTLGTFVNSEAIELLTCSKTCSKAVPRVAPWNSARALRCQVTEISADPIKIRGGYVATTSVTSASADLGLDAGGARGKFWARNAVAGLRLALDLGDRASCAVEGKNGGFLPFSGLLRGHVGMPMLECEANVALDQGFAPACCQPAGLNGVALAGQIGMGGGDADRQGVPPPTAPRFSPSSKAQAIFLVSTALRIAGSPVGRVGPNGRLNSCIEMGSGVCILSLASRDRRKGADHQKRHRVGGQVEVLSWGRSAEATTLWGGSHRVN